MAQAPEVIGHQLTLIYNVFTGNGYRKYAASTQAICFPLRTGWQLPGLG
jgi:hypothetical protein